MPKLILGEDYLPALKEALSAHGFSCIPVPANPSVDERVRCHCDLSACKVDYRLFFADDVLTEAFKREVETNGYEVIPLHIVQGPVYPDDCPLNAAVCDCFAILNPVTASGALVRELRARKLIKVKQGYTKCNAILLPEGAVITEDPGIAIAAAREELSVLQLEPGGVTLSGYPYGFIGGAAFVCGKTVYFTGSVEEHPQWQCIKSFLAGFGYHAVSLTQNPLFDIGGAIVLS